MRKDIIVFTFVDFLILHPDMDNRYCQFIGRDKYIVELVGLLVVAGPILGFSFGRRTCHCRLHGEKFVKTQNASSFPLFPRWKQRQPFHLISDWMIIMKRETATFR